MPPLHVPIGDLNHLQFVYVAGTNTEQDMQGDRELLLIWDIRVNPRATSPDSVIQRAMNNEHIVHGEYWFPASTSQFRACIAHVQEYSSYCAVKPFVEEMLSDPELHVYYYQIAKSEGKLMQLSMWICSPKYHRIALLHP